MTAILLKIVVFFCLFDQIMSGTFITRFTSDREHYAVTQIVQFPMYLKCAYEAHIRWRSYTV